MKYAFLVLMMVNSLAYSQRNPGPRFTAMGSGGAALQDIWSLQQNPAGTAESGNALFAIASEYHLIDSELSTQSALFILPYGKNVFGFSLERYGLTEYAEQTAGLTYARKFGNSLRLAIGLRYHQLNITQYGSARAFTVEAGFQLNVTDEFIIASHIANPNRNRFESLSDSNLPVKLSVGASYKFSDKILMSTDIRKILNYPLDITTGIEYSMIKHFSLRGGISVNPFKQYTGFGFVYRNVHIDMAIASHPDLRYSPQIALGYEF